MKIIDVHAHIFPQKISEKAVKSIGDFYEIPMTSNKGTSEALIESGSKIGVSKYLVFSTATKKEQVESINRFIISECRKHSEFMGLGTMFVEYDGFEKELDFLKESGIKGIKLHPDFQKFAFDDERLYPIFEYLAKKNMFVLTHSGDKRYHFSNPDKITRVAKLFPDLNIIAAHFGGWSEWEAAAEAPKLDNVFYDTSSTLLLTEKEKVFKILNKFDKSHFFFGTDFPMWGHEEEFAAFMDLKLPDKLCEDILYNNFAKFYGV